MDANLLSNLASYSAQIAVIAAVGGLVSAVLRIEAAGVRYTYWRALLALCLVLPWIQGRVSPAPVTEVASPAATALAPAAAASAISASGQAAGAGLPWLPVLAAILLCGTAARLGWIGLGLVRLRRLRSTGQAAPRDEHDELQRTMGTSAEIRYVDDLRQPVTFGAIRPIVLLPDALRAQPASLQGAVLSHELFHVRRRDWIWVLAEEMVRAVFWFHPGVWWLISRIQLAREEVVDELTVLATGARRAYLEALMTFADETPLAPAAAFARRRHLFRRIRLISKEAVMSSHRVVASCAVMATAVLAGSWYAIGAFPLSAPTPPAAQELLDAPGPLERSAHPITPENPVPRRVHSVMPVFPPDADPAIRIAVTLRLTLDHSGRVAEISTGQTPAATDDLIRPFFRAAVEAVRQWQYEAPAQAPISFDVTFGFGPDSQVQQLVHAGLPSRSPIYRLQGTVPPPTAPGGRGGRSAGPTSPSSSPTPGPAESPVRVPPAWDGGPVRVGGSILPPAKVKDVPPVYPPLAQAAQVQGVVILEVTIDPSGRVTDARVLRSIPLLDQAAIDAVRQWEFTPTRLNGVPVPVIMAVTVRFTLT